MICIIKTVLKFILCLSFLVFNLDILVFDACANLKECR